MSNINSLPNENTSENVVVNINDNKPMANANTTTDLSQDTINEIVRGIQVASQQNLTNLPSRDIPMTTDHITNDNTVRPNHIPDTNLENYIDNEEYELNNMYKHNHNKNDNNMHGIEEFYQEFQTPIIIMLLYFLTQLPFYNKLLFKNLPYMFNKDANIDDYLLG